MGKKYLQLLPISWLRASGTLKSCVDWAKHLRLLSNLILKGSRKTTPKCGSEFYTFYTFNGKIYVVLDKGMWKRSGIALEVPTGLNGPGNSCLGPPCPWSKAPFKSLGLSVPALVMLQQCWSPWPCWGVLACLCGDSQSPGKKSLLGVNVEWRATGVEIQWMFL